MESTARVKILQKFLAELGIEWNAMLSVPVDSKVYFDATDDKLKDMIDLHVKIKGKEYYKTFWYTEKFFFMYEYKSNVVEENFTPEWKAFQKQFIEDDKAEEEKLNQQSKKFYSQNEAMMEERLDEILGPHIRPIKDDLEYEDD